MREDATFVRACRRQPVAYTPVWFMRQAGRYLPEYRALRERLSLPEMLRRPDVCAEVTVQPLHRLNVDAAILFSDLSVLFEALEVPFELREGAGPVVQRPIRDGAAVDALPEVGPTIRQRLPYVFESIRLLVPRLPVPLIGFCGGPFTLAAYLIEGGPSRQYEQTKRFMHADRSRWDALMERLTGAAAAFLEAQVADGAAAVQVFDSWVGALSPADFRTYVASWVKRLLARAEATGAPAIYFGVQTAGLLEAITACAPSVVGIDWRVGLDDAWHRLGPQRAIQGNLDPAALLAPREVLARQAGAVLQAAGGRPGHIFNLGHGVLPSTDPDALAWLVDFVHERSAAGAPAAGRPKEGGAARAHSTPAHHRQPPAPAGVLLMAYGGPEQLDDLEPYYTHVRGGRRPGPEQLAELAARYLAIGGRSPLADITLRQAAALEQRLAQVPAPAGGAWRVYVGMRHWRPWIDEAVARMAADGVREAVTITLAPHYSRMSVEAYIAAVEAAVDRLPPGTGRPHFRHVRSWSTHPGLVAALANRIVPLLGPDGARVVFTAHSLPQRIVAEADPYPEELGRTCRAVAARLGPGAHEWHFAYQSQGRTPEPWLGPELPQVLAQLASTAGSRRVVVCPVGFVADHLEVLYDLDIEARARAYALGLQLVRTPSLNDAPDLIDVLADLVVRAFDGEAAGQAVAPARGGVEVP